MKRIPNAFEGVIDDCEVDRWSPGVAAGHGGEDECFAAFRVIFTMTREEAIALLGADNLPTLPRECSAVTTDDMPHNGERWALVRVDG